MAKRKTVFRLLLGLACSAAILWLGVGCGEPDYQCGTESLEQATKTLEVPTTFVALSRPPPTQDEFLRDEETGQRTKHGAS